MQEVFTGGWMDWLEQVELLLAHPLCYVALLVISLLLLHRQLVLSFGARQIGFFSHFILVLFLILPLFMGILAASQALLTLFVLEFALELYVAAIYQHRNAMFGLNVGVFLSILTLIHPGYFLLLPYLLVQLRVIDNRSWRHVLALLIGLLMLWWLKLLLAVPPPEQVVTYLMGELSPLWQIKMPRLEHLPSIIALLALFIQVVVLHQWHHNSSIQRHRIIISGHRLLSFILIVCFVLYVGNTEEVNAFSFYMGAVFFLLTQVYYFVCNHRKSPFIAFVSIAIALGAVGFQAVLSKLPFF